jgi:membrane-associated protein
MELIKYWLDLLLHLNVHLAQWINAYGIWTYGLLFLIIFCETGLVITPFLPGDSLLFAAGSLIASSELNIHLLVIILIIAALCGDNVNYWLGRWIGPKIFTSNARWFKRQYLDMTHAFYERHGSQAIIIARFLPIVRTYVPFVAGIGKMQYGKFLGFSALGAILWVGILLYASYWFGRIPVVQQHFSYIAVAIIIVSILPTAIAVLKHKRAKRS